MSRDKDEIVNRAPNSNRDSLERDFRNVLTKADVGSKLRRDEIFTQIRYLILPFDAVWCFDVQDKIFFDIEDG